MEVNLYNDSAMNKKNTINYNLNTITIDYTRRSNSIKAHKLKSELRQQYQQNYIDRDSVINTIDYNSQNEQQEGNQEFSDKGLKQPQKSQTMKEGQFNKMRVHIYRKEKRSKWLDLPVRDKIEADRERIKCQLEEQYLRRKDLKTVMVRRKLVDRSLFQPKMHVRSSQKRINSPIKHRQIQDNLNESQSQRAGSPQILQKLDKVLKDVTLKVAVHKKSSEQIDERKRNLSQNTSNIRKRLAKLQMKRFVGPFRLRQNMAKKVLQKKQAIKEQPDIHDSQFQAWEYVDIFTSKHGIEQYADEVSNNFDETLDKKGEPNMKKKI